MTSPPYVWLATPEAGQWFSAETPIIGVTDRGLAYGDGVFETVQVRDAIPLFLARHLQRLRASLEQLGFPPPAQADEELQAWCDQVVEKNFITAGVLKITVTRGAGVRGFAPPAEVQPVLVIQATEKPKVGYLDKPGLSAALTPWKIDPASPLCGVKSLSALDKVLARQWAQAHGVDEALFQNLGGLLTEATAWNLFVVNHEQILTPAQHCGLLPGITRALLLETTAAVEAELPVEVLALAQEAFLTNAVGGVQPLVRFNDHPIGLGQPGPVTGAMAAHLEQLEVDYVRRANASKKATVL